jgi:hypothetical protein
MDEYAHLLLKIGELEGALVAARNELRSIPRRMTDDLTTDRQRLEAARYLYWNSDIPAQQIAEGLLGMDLNGWHVDRFLERIGTLTLDVECDICHRPMECRSRQKMLETIRAARGGPKYAEGYRVLCEPCWQAVQYERAHSWKPFQT